MADLEDLAVRVGLLEFSLGVLAAWVQQDRQPTGTEAAPLLVDGGRALVAAHQRRIADGLRDLQQHLSDVLDIVEGRAEPLPPRR